MTSILSGLFTSASKALSNRVENLRNAEANLIIFSRRFGGGGQNIVIETFDTKIPRKCVPLKNGCKCLVFLDQKDEDHYVMHGVKVTSSSNDNSSSSNDMNNKKQRPPLVLLHGYANGAMYFYRNLLGLQRHFGTVFSLDLLGWGLSSRPKFLPSSDGVKLAEDVFVESLEAWRRAHGVERMVLAGHSMGGYLGVAYCERYPERVDRLVLLSPVGVPEKPETNTSTSSNTDWRRRTLFGLMRTLWNHNITPGAFIRSITERRGRDLVMSYLDRRLPALADADDEKEQLGEYLYTNSILPGSGEYALNRLLEPIAYARKPMVHRIPQLQIPRVAFVYGKRDWMDPNGGLDVQRRCASSSPKVEVYAVRNAGHLLLLDNWEEFNAAVIMADGGEPPASSPQPVKLT